MNDLTRYFPKAVLEFCHDIYRELIVERSVEGRKALGIGSCGENGRRLLQDSGMSQEDVGPSAIAYRCLGLFMEQGVVIVRPSLTLCEALDDTQVNIKASEFHMPFPIMAVELPPSVLGRHAGSLSVIWKICEDIVVLWTMSVAPDHVMYHTTFGNDTDTLEDRLVADDPDDEDERRLMTIGGRIALNCCLLASHRKTTTSPLPPRVLRNRRAQDPRLRRLAQRTFQEMSFRDLVLTERPSYNPSGGFGARGPHASQLRRGHWKRVVHGPKGSLRRLQWINPYTTGEAGDDKPTIILK